ncbi:hypothetical protein MKW98_005694, partial [Papaver atlanticum]
VENALHRVAQHRENAQKICPRKKLPKLFTSDCTLKIIYTTYRKGYLRKGYLMSFTSFRTFLFWLITSSRILLRRDNTEKDEKQLNITIGILVSVALVMLIIFYRILFGGKKAVVYWCCFSLFCWC